MEPSNTDDTAIDDIDFFWSNETEPQEMTTATMYLSVILALLIVVFSSWLVPCNYAAAADASGDQKRLDETTVSNNATTAHHEGNNNTTTTFTVPIIFMEEPYWNSLSSMLEKYRQDASNLLKSLSQSLELALHSEREMMGMLSPVMDAEDEPNSEQQPKKLFLFSQQLQTRLDRVAACLDHNEKELIQIMKAFEVRFALPHRPQTAEDVLRDVGIRRKQQQSTPKQEPSRSTLFTMKQNFAADPSLAKKNAYDCGAQVIAHIVRDWTELGAGVRASTYDWCRQQVEQHVSVPVNNNTSPSLALLPILVPGAGLGRLAYDLAFLSGYPVEANEISLSMTTAAHAILQQKKSGNFYPFALDAMANEVESERRYDSVQYPDLDMNDKSNNHHRGVGSLSYTVGDFVSIYRWQRPRASFGCVVTCFFLDTSTNIYELLSVIEHALAKGGIWINVGPLRWHYNSMLHPAADELRSLIESSIFEFQVIHWSIDQTPSEYRHQDPEFFIRSTSYEGYR